MTTKEIISALQPGMRRKESEALKQAVFYKLYMDGLSGNDISRLFDVKKPNLYQHIYNFRDRLSINDAVCVNAKKELEAHDLVVDLIIVRYKIAGYTIKIDGEECFKTKG